MSNFLFFDPNGYHQKLPINVDIELVQNANELHDILVNDNQLQMIVCVCCNDKSKIIQSIQNNPQVISIYSCKEHGKSEKNSSFGPKVREDLILTRNSGWEFKGRLDLLKASMKNSYDEEVLNEHED